MTPPRFQFTIRGLLWATFWVAIYLAQVACVKEPSGLMLLADSVIVLAAVYFYRENKNLTLWTAAISAVIVTLIAIVLSRVPVS